MSNDQPADGPTSGAVTDTRDAQLPPAQSRGNREASAPRTAAEWADESRALTPPVDATDADLEFEDDFELLRGQLFNNDFLEQYPADLEPAADPAVQPEPEPAADPAVQPEPEPAAAGGEPPDLTLDWATVSPQYVPQVEDTSSRGRWLALVALVVVICAVGVWLMYGPSASRGGAGTRPGGATAGSLAGGVPGVDAEVTLANNAETVVVSQHVVLREETSVITITVPDRSQTPSLSDFDPRVHDLRVVVVGRVLEGVDTNLAVGQTITVRFPNPTREFQVDYSAAGAVDNSQPSTQGRGLALATVIWIDGLDGLTSTTDVNGARILNTGCIQAGQSLVACGDQTTDGWRVVQVLKSAGTNVVAQFDIPD